MALPTEKGQILGGIVCFPFPHPPAVFFSIWAQLT